MANGLSEGAIEAVMDEYFAIQDLFDQGFRAQAELDLSAFEHATGRQLDPAERDTFLESQHRALAWTFLGSAMANARFQAELAGISSPARARVAAAADRYRLN